MRPTADGTVRVDVPEDVARDDAAGNNNTAADRFSVTYDGTIPFPVITAMQASPTNAATINFNVTFSQPVTGFDGTDITLGGNASTNGVGNFEAINATDYSFGVVPTGDGTILVEIATERGPERDRHSHLPQPARPTPSYTTAPHRSRSSPPTSLP